uniref:DNA repair protein RAD5 n=1 Tax=Kwoniella pini CBS 10737 TaxID=1296096 RepID=A0A1B9I9A8_9TREE|nr:uncharacterized protein I206_01401 [Kwoniella pini CBS 10737]OCF52116.1 hypothetical protein I206_01401 [Kwoniella pini CBS 10737]
MFSEKEMKEAARKTLGLDEEPDKETPKFYLDAFREHTKKCPYDSHFIIELADSTKNGSEIGGNGFGVITCMEDYCWKDIILSADPLKPDGGRSDGFGSFSDFQDHCDEPDHKRGRSERCNRLGINDQINPCSSHSSSLPSRPPPSFEYPSSSASVAIKSSILDEPSVAGPSNLDRSTEIRAAPSEPTYRESKPVIHPSSSPSRSIFDLTQPQTSSSTNRQRSIDIITIDSSSPMKSDPEEIDELAVDSEDDNDDILLLEDDEIPSEYRKVTNRDNPIPLDDSESEDDMQIRDRGKGKAVSRSNSNRTPLAPIFNMSQSNRQQDSGVEMIRDDSGDSLEARQKSFDALFSPSTSRLSKGNTRDTSSGANNIIALSSEEKVKMMQEEDSRSNTPAAAPSASASAPAQTLHILVTGRLRILEHLKNGIGSTAYFPPSPQLLAMLPALKTYGPPNDQLPLIKSATDNKPLVNGHNGYGGLNMPEQIKGEHDPLYIPQHQLTICHPYSLSSFFDENMKDFVEDTTVDDSLKKLGLNSMEDYLPDLRIKLMAHQVLGVDFMIEKEKAQKFLGGINADAMGLGKTVQSIATIASHQSEDPRVKSTLIIAPLALLQQWKNEIESKTTPGLLRVLIYHGQKRTKTKNHLKQYDVVLTTYGTLVAESGPKEKGKKKNGSDDDEAYNDIRKQGPLMKVHWWRIILDEAHQIRNRRTRAAKACFQLKAHLRWCLTGTPIVNTLEDVFSYLHFLSISPAASWEHFRGHISQIQKRRPKLATKRMQAILRQCCIRRHKESELNGQKLLQLKPKHTNVDTLNFTDDERQIYTAIENRFQVRFNSYLKKGTVMKHYSVVLVMLLRLRQLTCHPWLLRRNANDGGHEQDVLVTDEDLLTGVSAVKLDDIAEVARAKTLLGEEAVAQIKKKLAERQAKINDAASDDTEVSKEEECPICSDIFTDERITPCYHSFCAPCLEDVFNNIANNVDLRDVDDGKRSCPLCRGQIERGKIFRADAFIEHDKEEEASDMAEEDGIENDIDAKLEVGTEEYEESHTKGKRKAVTRLVSKKVKKDSDVNGEGEDPLAEVTDELAMEDVLPSTKMKKLGDLIDDINAKDPNDKIIVFSQFVQFIELCSLFLTRKNVNHVRYMGSMKQDERENVLQQFGQSLKDHPKSPKVILMSLKCGGVGLNLCAANHVICMDLAWNAATENQAVDRAHRIGQDKEVHVHRLVIQDTVEQRIMKLQEEKQALSDGAMGEGAAGRLGRLSIRDLMRLFAVGGDGED